MSEYFKHYGQQSTFPIFRKRSGPGDVGGLAFGEVEGACRSGHALRSFGALGVDHLFAKSRPGSALSLVRAQYALVSQTNDDARYERASPSISPFDSSNDDVVERPLYP